MAYRNTRTARKALQELAVTQGGYVTSQQAAGIGYGPQHLAYHVRAGNLERVGWGLYRLHGLPLVPHDDLIRWSLWSRDRSGASRAVIGHESAAAVHELGDALPATVHLVVPPGFRKHEPRGCTLHRAGLATEDVEIHEGYRVTTPSRTLLDLAARTGFSSRELHRMLRDATERGLIRAHVFRRQAERRALVGRLGLAGKASRRKA